MAKLPKKDAAGPSKIIRGFKGIIEAAKAKLGMESLNKTLKTMLVPTKIRIPVKIISSMFMNIYIYILYIIL